MQLERGLSVLIIGVVQASSIGRLARSCVAGGALWLPEWPLRRCEYPTDLFPFSATPLVKKHP